MNEELQPCPFCGTVPSVRDNIEPRLYIEDPPRYCVYCASCDLLFGFDSDYGGEFKTKEEAIKAWNTRVCNNDNAKTEDEELKPCPFLS